MTEQPTDTEEASETQGATCHHGADLKTSTSDEKPFAVGPQGGGKGPKMHPKKRGIRFFSVSASENSYLEGECVFGLS